MTPASPSPPRRGSAVRLAIGGLLCAVAIATSAYGLLRLALVLEQGGYGTPAVRGALGILGMAGGVLATGIALIIWDVSLRHER